MNAKFLMMSAVGFFGLLASQADAQLPDSYGLAASQSSYYLAQNVPASGGQIGPPVYYPAAGGSPCDCPPQAVQSPPVVGGTPVAPVIVPAPQVAYRPVVPLVAMPPQVQVGRGILGQPTVYVPGQPIRNFLRYFSP